MAEVVKKKFLREFQSNLFPDNMFWTKAKSDSGADQFTSIDIPIAATPVSSTFGAIQDGQANGANANTLTAKVRVNNTKNYPIEVFGTEPVALQLIDLDTISYNKRAELYKEHQDVINTDVANYAAIQYASNVQASQILTTGGARVNIVTGGFSGNVKSITKDDMINVKRIFHRQNIMNKPGQLYGLITPEQWDDILKIPEFVDYEKTGQLSKLKEGVIGRLLGIEIMVPRHNPALNANVVYATNGLGNKLEFGAALSGTETSAAVFWHSGMVRYSKGSGMLYERKKDPIYKSDIMSADVRFGATQSRTDGAGVVTLIEDVEP